ncbi:MAG: 50S ribosomal protein L21 [Kiritimatiellales bacterium]|nr:50S ribosomal protein L21 [Kiritimatiellales bacterium]
MEAYAVIETGGKQYRVQQGDVFDVELLHTETDANLEFDVLAVSDGEKLTVGAPLVENAKVKVSVVDEHLRGKKIYSFKKKRRKGYRRKIGHRQELTKIKVESITA